MKVSKLVAALIAISAVSAVSMARGQEGYGVIRKTRKLELNCGALTADDGNGGIVAGALSPSVYSDEDNRLYVRS